MNYMTHQLLELAVIAKHLQAMDEEVQRLRSNTPWSWGDGLFVDLQIKVKSDADDLIGEFVSSEADGYDFYPHNEESNA